MEFGLTRKWFLCIIMYDQVVYKKHKIQEVSGKIVMTSLRENNFCNGGLH